MKIFCRVILFTIGLFFNFLGMGAFAANNDASQEYSAKDPQFAHDVWAKKILNGGYILVFRHAFREKWYDVQLYDALESDVHDNGPDGTRFGEYEYFKRAVCLSERGQIQARAMGELVEYSKLPVGVVLSSPSCRARQTANITFGGYDELLRDLVHRGPYLEEVDDHVAKMRKLFLETKILSGKNIIISAHNSVVHKKMFDHIAPSPDSDKKRPLTLVEGGFHVVSRQGDQLVVEHTFKNFVYFSKNFFPR